LQVEHPVPEVHTAQFEMQLVQVDPERYIEVGQVVQVEAAEQVLHPEQATQVLVEVCKNVASGQVKHLAKVLSQVAQLPVHCLQGVSIVAPERHDVQILAALHCLQLPDPQVVQVDPTI
jgi:hypothetical protein